MYIAATFFLIKLLLNYNIYYFDDPLTFYLTQNRWRNIILVAAYFKFAFLNKTSENLNSRLPLCLLNTFVLPRWCIPQTLMTQWPLLFCEAHFTQTQCQLWHILNNYFNIYFNLTSLTSRQHHTSFPHIYLFCQLMVILHLNVVCVSHCSTRF